MRDTTWVQLVDGPSDGLRVQVESWDGEPQRLIYVALLDTDTPLALTTTIAKQDLDVAYRAGWNMYVRTDSESVIYKWEMLESNQPCP